MKFIVDAQLPRRLVIHLRRLGYDAQHTWGLESGNRTPDNRVAQIADNEGAIVVSKDADFLNSHILNRSPKKLLLISTGNISNKILLDLFEQHIEAITSALEESSSVELNQQGLVIH
jgi:predicted nuclease of predicted toxin-antitoxin system